MPENQLHHLSIEWEPGSRDNLFPRLTPAQVRILTNGLEEAVREGVINEFSLEPAFEDDFKGVLELFSTTELRRFVGPKDWAPDRRPRRKS